MVEESQEFHLFISYKRDTQDQKSVYKIVKKLEESFDPNNVWYDLKIPGGADWVEKIDNAIKNCNVFIYMLSEDSLKSEQCLREFKVALAFKKPLLPVLIRGDKGIFGSAPDDVKQMLGRIQFVDMTGRNEMAFARLVRAIHEAESKRRSTQQVPKVSITITAREFIVQFGRRKFLIAIASVFLVAFILYRNLSNTNLISTPTPTSTQNTTILEQTLTLSPTLLPTNTLTLSPTITHTLTRTVTPKIPTSIAPLDVAASATFAALDTRQAARFFTPTHTPTPLPTCTPTSTPDANLTPDKTATSKFETLEARLNAIQGATSTPLLTPLPDGCLS